MSIPAKVVTSISGRDASMLCLLLPAHTNPYSDKEGLCGGCWTGDWVLEIQRRGCSMGCVRCGSVMLPLAIVPDYVRDHIDQHVEHLGLPPVQWETDLFRARAYDHLRLERSKRRSRATMRSTGLAAATARRA